MNNTRIDTAINIYKKICLLLDEMADGDSVKGNFLRHVVPTKAVEEMRLLKKDLEDHGIAIIIQERSN